MGTGQPQKGGDIANREIRRGKVFLFCTTTQGKVLIRIRVGKNKGKK